MRLTRTRLGVVLAAAAIAITGSVTAAASPAYAAEDVGEGGHCVENMQEPTQRCFRTYEEARAYVAEVADVLPDKPPTGGTQAPGALALKPVLIFIGYDFENFNPSGGTLWVIGLGGPCTLSFADIDYQLSLGGPFLKRWDNDISSYQDFSICWTRLYDASNCTGVFRGYLPDSPTLGVWNNRASCIRWT